MAILRIDELRYGVNGLGTCIEFFENWGLNKIENGTTGTRFKTLENQVITLRKANGKALPPTNEDGPTVREIIWGVDTKAELEDIAAELGTDREVSIDDGSIHTQDDCGNWIGFKLAESTPADVPMVEMNFHENVRRTNERGWLKERAQPLRIAHAVYSLEKENVWDGAKFYMDRLKFRLTDRTRDGGTFLRCEGS